MVGRESLTNGEWPVKTLSDGDAEIRSLVLFETLSTHVTGHWLVPQRSHEIFKPVAVSPPRVSPNPPAALIAPTSPTLCSHVIG